MTKATLFWILRLALKVLTIVLYIATLLSAYGGYFDPVWWTLPAIGVLFFPYFAMGTLMAAAAWIICRRFVIGCVGVGVLLACGPTFPEAMPFRFGNKPTVAENTFKMVTYNCLHMVDTQNPDSMALRYNLKLPEGKKSELPYGFNRSLHFLIHCGADFICLQELNKFGPPEIPDRYRSQIDSLLKEYPYYTDDAFREIEFISKIPFRQIEVNLGLEIKYGSCSAYEMRVDGRKLTVIAVHLPSYRLSEDERRILTEITNRNGMKNSIKEFEGSVYEKMRIAFAERAKVSEAIADFADKTEGNVIICGDFNDVPGSWSYRNFTKRGFEDAYAQTGFGHMITYNEHLMWFHIDQILYKGELVPLYVRKERLNTSDHYPLVAEFEFL